MVVTIVYVSITVCASLITIWIVSRETRQRELERAIDSTTTPTATR
jgi:hypothetical protein